MSHEEMFNRKTVSLLIQINKNLKNQEELLIVVALQLIELNRLVKKLNYISGTDSGVTEKELKEELEFLKGYVEKYSEEPSKMTKLLYLPKPNKEGDKQ